MEYVPRNVYVQGEGSYSGKVGVEFTVGETLVKKLRRIRVRDICIVCYIYTKTYIVEKMTFKVSFFSYHLLETGCYKTKTRKI